MKKILFILGLFMAFAADSQPLNYTRISNRYRWVSGMFDSALYVPRYNGTPSGVRVGENSAIDGAIAIDTANSRAYMYSGGAWVRLANYSEIGGTYTAGDGLLLTASDFKVLTKRSITIDSDSLMLVNDTTATPANYFYGMNSAGRRTWLPQSGLSAGTVPISGLTAATGANTINNGAYGQDWQWNTLASGSALKLSSSSTAATGGQKILEVQLTGSNAGMGEFTYGTWVKNSRAGSLPVNYGVYSEVSNGSFNYAFYGINSVMNSGNSRAGYFEGGVNITGATTTGSTAGSTLSINGNALTSGTLADISGTSTALASGNEALNISVSGANATNGITATGARISVTNTNGTSGTNVGLDITATGATTANYALKLVDGAQGQGKVLTSDASGNAAWKYDTTTLVTFTAGANFAADTAAFTDSTIYGSFKLMGNDTFYVTGVSAVLYSNNAITDTLGIQITYNDTINVVGSNVFASTYPINNETTGQDADGDDFTGSNSVAIPPGNWVWLKSPTVVAGRKPYHLSVSIIGYKKRVN